MKLIESIIIAFFALVYGVFAVVATGLRLFVMMPILFITIFIGAKAEEMIKK